MTTLIIEPKTTPQDVPGVVIPPPCESEPVIKNTGFFPDVDPKRVREEMRLEQTVSPVRLRRAIKTAIAETNAELRDWRDLQLDAGHATLADVPSDELDGESVRCFHYFRPTSISQDVQYPQRELLAFSRADKKYIEELVADDLGNSSIF